MQGPILVVISLLLAAGSAYDFQRYLQDFQQYLLDFDKHYSAEEEPIRQAIFMHKLAEIETTNALELPYKLGVNNFTDWTEEEIAAYVNATRDPNAPIGEISNQGKRVGGPTSYDWRSSGKISPIKNQGSCGACWAFSSTAVYESLILIRNGTTLDLSEEYILECSNRSYSDCGGGRVSDAYSLMARAGIPYESSYPYQATSSGSVTPNTGGICSASGQVKLAGAVTYKILTNLSIPDMKSLVLTAPYVALVYADSGFMAYTSGVYGCATANDSLLNHAVTVIGYNDTTFLIKNSWSTGWGVSGYMWLNQTSNCGLNLWVYQLTEGDPPPSSKSFAWIAAPFIILTLLMV